MKQNNLEICFTPAAFEAHADSEAVAIVIDVLRATSAICTAFANGVLEIMPIETVEEARALKEQGHLVAAERHGSVLDFADFGNSPFGFTPEKVKGKKIVFSTTNGTAIMKRASVCHDVVIGSWLNLSVVCDWVVEQGRDVVIVCAGWKDRFSLEDSVCAGAIAERLLESGKFSTICDAVHAATDLWSIAKPDLLGYMDKAAQKTRLGKKGLADCIPYCHTIDISDVVPVLRDGRLIPL